MMQSTTIEINGNTYRVCRLPAMQSMHIDRKLARVLPRLLPLLLALLKTQGGEAMQLVDELLVEVAGAYGAVDQPLARVAGSNQAAVGPEAVLTAMPRYLNDRAASIYGGSNEIQRDIMARLVLGH